MRPFDSLTLRGRARRLRRLALAALPSWDLDVQRMTLLDNSWNGVFRVDATQGRSVLRVGIPDLGQTVATVRSEALFMAALARESDLRVPAPRRTRDGSLTVCAGAPGVPQERICVVFGWVPGKDLADEITPANWFKHGALHARMHDFAASWTPPAGFEIGDFTRTFHFPGERSLWDAELFGHERLLREALAATDERIAAIRRREPVIVTHGDLHHWNVKLHRGVLAPIDFEDAMWATRLQDVSTSLYYVSRRADYLELAAAFRAGYESVAPWVERVPGEVDRLLVARGLALVDIVAADAAFRVADWRATVERLARLARIALAATL